MPEEFLAGISIAQRADQWRTALTIRMQDNYIFVIETDEDGLVGFVASGPERDGRENYGGEIYAIYLIQQSQGRGLGRLLFDAAVSDFKQRGYTAFMLWVLAENPSRGFYERVGGIRIDEKEIEIGGISLKEVAYGWKEILMDHG